MRWFPALPMRAASLALACAASLTLASPAHAGEMSVVEWLNHECRTAQLVVLGQVKADAFPDAKTGVLPLRLRVGKVFLGPHPGTEALFRLKPAYPHGKYLLPAPAKAGQWMLLFLRKEGSGWVGGPTGRVVETPYQGFFFYPPPGTTLADASSGLSWDYMLAAMTQIVAVRHQIASGYQEQLRKADTTEERDRLRLSIEWQVKERLGVPVP